MKKGIFLFSLLLLANSVIASTWSRTYSEANRYTSAYNVGPTFDGGFFAAGVSYTSPIDPDSSDITLMKVDAAAMFSGVKLTEEVSVISPTPQSKLLIQDF